jgi:predicted nucleic-acid-binding Zn-ribbon protein
MKVLEKRNDHVTKYKIKCKWCGSLLEYLESDIYQEGTVRTLYGEKTLIEQSYIQCPICRVDNLHEERIKDD